MDSSNINPSFDKIQKFIHRIDINSGAFVFKDPAIKLTTKEKFLSLTAIIYAVPTTFMIASTLYTKNFELVSVILCLSLSISVISFVVQMVKTHFNKDLVINLLEWCHSLYDIEKKFKSVFLHNIARTKLMKVQKFTEMIIVWFKNSLYSDLFFILIIAPLTAVFLPNIVTKFTPPLPFYLPFEDQHSWTCFLMTIFMQSIFCIFSVPIAIFIYDFFFCITSHIIGYLDIIQEIVETVFNEQIVKKVKEFDNAKPAESKGTLKVETLMEINDSIEIDNTDNHDELEFTEWMQLLCDMITEVNFQINTLKSLYREFFLLTEIQSLGALFICGFIITVIKQQYCVTFVIILVVMFFFISCINEFILQKLDNIEKAFYNIPWYYLSVKEQRMLLIALNCFKIQQGFTAAGIHELTLERFYAVIKLGYKNFLVLKDLVT